MNWNELSGRILPHILRVAGAAEESLWEKGEREALLCRLVFLRTVKVYAKSLAL